MTPKQYMEYKYKVYNIDRSLILTKENLKTHDFGELWWNGVISGNYEIHCTECYNDTQRFKKMKKDGIDVSNFDNPSKGSYKRGEKKTDTRNCTPSCFWFDYFYARRIVN